MNAIISDCPNDKTLIRLSEVIPNSSYEWPGFFNLPLNNKRILTVGVQLNQEDTPVFIIQVIGERAKLIDFASTNEMPLNTSDDELISWIREVALSLE